MAETVTIAPGGGTAKIRHPWGVLGLMIITIGIYYLFWWYFINREMRDLGRARNVDLGSSPGMSVVAITIGGIIIVPPFVSVWNTGRRMEGTQRAVGVSGGSGPLFFVMSIIPIVSLFSPVYMQGNLNDAWRAMSGAIAAPATVAPAFDAPVPAASAIDAPAFDAPAGTASETDAPHDDV